MVMEKFLELQSIHVYLKDFGFLNNITGINWTILFSVNAHQISSFAKNNNFILIIDKDKLGKFPGVSNYLDDPQALAERLNYVSNFGGGRINDILTCIMQLRIAIMNCRVCTSLIVNDDIVYELTARYLAYDTDYIGLNIPKSIVDLCEYISKNLKDDFTMEHFAQISNLSIRSLQYKFKKYLGCTPTEWVRYQKLVKIKSILESLDHKSALRISDVATDYGFTNPGWFARVYKERFGELPSETTVRVKSNTIFANPVDKQR